MNVNQTSLKHWLFVDKGRLLPQNLLFSDIRAKTVSF